MQADLNNHVAAILVQRKGAPPHGWISVHSEGHPKRVYHLDSDGHGMCQHHPNFSSMKDMLPQLLMDCQAVPFIYHLLQQSPWLQRAVIHAQGHTLS